MIRIRLGLSPCPNDTFIFHALLHGRIRPEYREDVEFEPFFADVEELNRRALAGELPFSKISSGVLPEIMDKYILLSSGGALGWGCGPLVVAANMDFDPLSARIAIPGRHTTANLLLNLYGGFRGSRTEMQFNEIMPAIQRGDADLGVIIHEGRFTYPDHGLIKVLDLGEWWESAFHLPLPLGAIVARRDVDPELAKAVQKGIAASLCYAWANPDESVSFIHEHAQEVDEKVICAHINTFVNNYSLDPAEEGRKAYECILSGAPVGATHNGLFL